MDRVSFDVARRSLLAPIVFLLLAVLLVAGGAGAQSTITNPPIGEATNGDGRHRMFFDPGFDRHWAFVTTGAAIETYYADDQLVLWSAAGAAVSGAITDFALSFIRYNGDSIVLVVWSDGEDLFYRRGEINDTTITWGMETEILNDSFEYVSPSVTITEAGHVWIAAVRKDPASQSVASKHLIALEATSLIDQLNLTFNYYEVGSASASLDRVAIVPYDLNHVYIVSNGEGQNVVAFRSTPGPVFTQVTQGGDEGWLTFPSGGLNGEVRAVALVGSELYAGGAFTDASGDENADYLAKWDDGNSKWVSLPDGPLNGEVWTLRGQGSELLIGGDFTDAGGIPSADYAAVFGGASFSPVGDGNITGGRVLAILRDGLRTYVGGRFTSADGKPGTRGIAAFDSGAGMWISVDGGLQPTDNEVRTLHLANGDLFVGGDFEDLGHPDNDYIALYDGVDWQKAGKLPTDLLNGPVNAIESDATHVFLGGEFTNGGGTGGDYLLRVDLSDLAWDYIWQDFLNAPVYSLEMYGSKLLLGGDFTAAGNVPPLNPLRRFAETDVTMGVNFTELEAGSDGRVSSIVFGAGAVFLGGRFTRINQTATTFVARYGDPGITSYSGGPVSLNGTIRAAAFLNGTLYIGGDFQDASGDTDADYIARWNGSSFEAPPSSNGYPSGPVHALFADGADLYVGGAFTDVGGNSSLARIARYGGTSFSQLDSVQLPVGAVNAIAKYQGEIILGGSFTGSVGQISPRVTSYNRGTNQYSEMADGFDLPVNVLLATDDGSLLYAGGSFTQSGMDTMQHLAEWNGSSWAAPGPPTHFDNGAVYALAEGDLGIYVGGDFENVGSNPDQDNIVLLSNGVYIELDGGTDGPVYSLLARDSRVYAAGSFTQAGGNAAIAFAYWDEQATAWVEAKGGVTRDPKVLFEEPVSGGILIGGSIGFVGGGASGVGAVTNNLAILGSVAASDTGLSSPFSAVSVDEDLHILYRDSEGKLSHREFVDGTGWGSVAQLSAAGSIDPFLAVDDSPSVLLAVWRDGADIKYNTKVGPATWPGSPLTMAGTNGPLGISLAYAPNSDDKFTLMWTEDTPGPLFVSKSQVITPTGGTTYKIAGTVTLGVQPLEDVEITASGINTTDTNSSGDYSFNGVPAGTNTVITPSLDGYSFSPSSRTISSLLGDSLDNDFSASLNDYTISGIVKRLDGSRLSGVTVSTAGFGSVTTDANGAYSLTVPHLTSYSLSFSKDGFRFTNLPADGQVNAGNVTLLDVTAIEQLPLGGRVVSPGGAGVGGIVITRGTAPDATTDPDGNFSFGVFDEGSSHTLAAVSDPDYRFEPASIAVTLPPAQPPEFTATRIYEASGTITLDGEPLAGVNVQFSSANGSASDSSDSAGFYSFSPIDDGTTYTITPTLSGFDFDPSSQAGTADQDRTIDFTASIRVGTITGTITADGSGVEGATVTLAKGDGDITDETDSSGRFTFTDIPTGTSYTVSASHPGYDIPGTSGGTLGSFAVHNFSATIRKFTVAGIVLVDDQPMEGVTIDGGTLGKKISDASGAFEFPNVPYNTDCVLTASLSGFEFPLEWRQTITGNVSTARLEGSGVLFPVLTCVRPEGGGAFTAFFGYRSDSETDVRVEVGPHNRFSPGQENAGQIIDFLAGPGTVSNAFSVLFDGNAITWHLAGGAVSASKRSRQCSNPGGSCPNGLVLDRCGVCGGDGMSCLGCLMVDMTELFEEIEQGVRRYLLALRVDGISARAARDSGAGMTARTTEALSGLPAENLACSNVTHCSDLDQGSAISALESVARDLSASASDTVSALRKAGRKKEARRIRRKTRKIGRMLRQDIASLPRYQSVCEE